MKSEQPWGFNIGCEIPWRSILNGKLKLAKDEEESLAYLKACEAPLLKDLLCKEALVNIDLSQAEPQGNWRSWVFSFFCVFLKVVFVLVKFL